PDLDDIGDAVGIIVVPVSRVIGSIEKILVPIPVPGSGAEMLDHTSGIDQVVPPVLIAVGIAIARSDQLGIRKQITKVDIGGCNVIGVRVDGHEILFTAAQAEKHGSGQCRQSNFIIHINEYAG